VHRYRWTMPQRWSTSFSLQLPVPCGSAARKSVSVVQPCCVATASVCKGNQIMAEMVGVCKGLHQQHP
jgi:hypothetical protein